jgi:hypothetical protein
MPWCPKVSFGTFRRFDGAESSRVPGGTSMSNVEKFLFARKEAAFSLGISIRSLDYLISRDKLVTRRIGKKVLVTRESLRTFARYHHPEAIKPEPK